MDVDVSVDGRLVFRSAMRQEDIYVSDADGGNITPLAPDENNDRFPRWSPDGTRIAFSSTKGDEGYEIHSIRPDGLDLRRLTFFEPSAVHFPLWSPDGRRLAFTAYVTAGGCTYVIDPDGPWPTEPLETAADDRPSRWISGIAPGRGRRMASASWHTPSVVRG